MRKSRLGAVVATSAALSMAAAAVPVTDAGAVTIPDGGVLRVAGGQSFADNFNPLNPAGTAGTAAGTGSAIYENLIYDNIYTGEQTDLLATGYQWSNGNKTLTVRTRQGVDWSDGTPFSAADVAFTFNYLKKYPGLDVNGVWGTTLQSVTAAGPGTVVFDFNAADTVLFPFIAAQKIVPAHIWSKITHPFTFTNRQPVGTGPFLLKSYNAKTVTYVKNPHYWMAGRPYIAGITMEAAKSDNAVQEALVNGEIDFAYEAFTDPEKSFVAPHPESNHFWWPVTDMNFLYFNTTEAPFNHNYFRKAIAMAINDNVVTDRAYFGAIPAGNGAEETGVTNGQASQWVPSSLGALEWSYDPSRALTMLESHGYKLVNGTLETSGGKPLPLFKILVGASWADYISMAETIGQELSALGIHTTIDQEPLPTYASEALNGNYQLLISWGNGNNSTPFYEYYYLLSPTETAPVGKKAGTNLERYTSPSVTAALIRFAKLASPANQEPDAVTIEKDVLQNVPVVALTGRPNFADYSTRMFAGWPRASDPYNEGDAPDNFDGGAEEMYLSVHLQ